MVFFYNIFPSCTAHSVESENSSVFQVAEMSVELNFGDIVNL